MADVKKPLWDFTSILSSGFRISTGPQDLTTGPANTWLQCISEFAIPLCTSIGRGASIPPALGFRCKQLVVEAITHFW